MKFCEKKDFLYDFSSIKIEVAHNSLETSFILL